MTRRARSVGLLLNCVVMITIGNVRTTMVGTSAQMPRYRKYAPSSWLFQLTLTDQLQTAVLACLGVVPDIREGP